ncbi:hypothetical protein M011DRAFT_115587 [Sporormia fimetaria CBS 119925]|uniref:RING-type domain-containing protein n=1 Tax=Sporormia fimetaria CBS 119925 TaxID=1340428 RepID=A0A6A6VLN4_9PLEO|nr:hypothetical protein M011DRAFT_115587 [Sporormia fimetaria CBS 119925]
MGTNTTGQASVDQRKESTTAIAVVLPSIFAIVLLMILAIAFVLPRLSGRESEASKAERTKRRMARLEEHARAQHFGDWSAQQGLASIGADTVCVICLDEIDLDAQIRPLRCCHIFHQTCLDDWYGRLNEYCPLCHRAIIPGTKEMVKKAPQPPPVAFLV